MKVKKGDIVIITVGKDRGRKGKIEKVHSKKNKVLVEGINVYKKHVKAQSKEKPGGIVELFRPLSVSNVALICPKCKKTTRVGYLFDKKGGLPAGKAGKHRVCKKCQEFID